VKLIVGLGNPGIEYQFTPHNMGFLAVDRIAEQCGVRVNNRHCRAQTARTRIAGHEVVLAKPETFMNLSGASVAELVREYDAQPEQDLILLYDELDLPFGSLRVRQRGRSAGHNGAQSVIGALGTQEITRVRIGIGPDHPVGDGARYVLSQFKKAQLPVVAEVLDQAAEAVNVILAGGVQVAMNRFNRKPEEEKEQGSGAGN
jgi:peptidyl-tRNA hydrolase, PTH1 family